MIKAINNGIEKELSGIIDKCMKNFDLDIVKSVLLIYGLTLDEILKIKQYRDSELSTNEIYVDLIEENLELRRKILDLEILQKQTKDKPIFSTFSRCEGKRVDSLRKKALEKQLCWDFDSIKKNDELDWTFDVFDSQNNFIARYEVVTTEEAKEQDKEFSENANYHLYWSEKPYGSGIGIYYPMNTEGFYFRMM